MSPSASKISPGIMDASGDGLVDGDELGAVGKGCLCLYLVNHFRNTLHHVFTREQGSAVTHELCDTTAVARPLQDRRRDVRDGFGIVELQAARLSAFSHEGCGEDQQF